MSKIKCLIVDDEPVAQRILAKYLSDLPEFEVVGTCLHAISALEVLQKQPIDLLFLDIEMPKIKGLAFLKTLQNPPHVIITTAHREYALDGFELEVIDYLLKPISFERFLKAINRFQRIQPVPLPRLSAEQSPRKILYVKSDRKTIKLYEEDIMYMEGMNNYIIIHHKDKPYIVYSSIGEMLDKLDDQFLRIHKSFVINTQYIVSFNQEMVEIGKKELPIGKTYKAVIQLF